MKMNLQLDNEKIKTNHKINEYGEVQKLIDRNVIRYMSPYTPKDTGNTIDTADDLTEIGSGKIVQGGEKTPYARHIYYNDANYTGAPIRGKEWFKRAMVEGGKDKILNDIQQQFGIRSDKK